MFLRFLSILLFLIFCSSCDKLKFFNAKETQALDTIVNFSVVDISPSFKNCNSIIDKIPKSICFRNTIHQKISKELLQHSFTIKDSISEIIYVDLLINSKGLISLQQIESSENILTQLPQLDSLLQVSVQKLPAVLSAKKRGIPVATKYRLPIRIQLKK
jgi:hypothetical protein